MSNAPHEVNDELIQPAEVVEAAGTLISDVSKSPLLLYGIFVELTRQFYLDENNLVLGTSATWNDDPDKSKIWIDTDYRWEDENPEFRPAIYVSIGNMLYTNPYAVIGRDEFKLDMQEGEYYYNRVCNGSITWTHIGRTMGETTLLAGQTADLFMAFATVIRDEYCFMNFDVKSISSGSVDKESQERYRRTVSAEFMFQENWSLKLESPKLKRIVFRAGQTGLSGGIVQ